MNVKVSIGGKLYTKSEAKELPYPIYIEIDDSCEPINISQAIKVRDTLTNILETEFKEEYEIILKKMEETKRLLNLAFIEIPKPEVEKEIPEKILNMTVRDLVSHFSEDNPLVLGYYKR